MAAIRKPFQGVYNIVRFNWHLYLISIAFISSGYILNSMLVQPYHIIVKALSVVSFTCLLSSLIISYYIYDLSGLYTLNWLNELNIPQAARLINIHAGFDESSSLLQLRYPNAALTVVDFYNPLKHTEVSIKRARKAYAPFCETIQIDTSYIPLPSNQADYIFLIFSAHEIRNVEERNHFFSELKRVLNPTGKIVLLEHLRDTPNLLAYNVGFWHFLSESTWNQTFNKVGLNIINKKRINPFVANFILEKDGSSD